MKSGRSACPTQSLPAAEIEKVVVDQIRCVGRDPKLLKEVLATAQAEVDAELATLRKERTELARELARHHTEMRHLATGGRTGAEPLIESFCDAALGVEVGPERPNESAYHLADLLNRDFSFQTDPGDGVSEVRVRRLRVDVVPVPGERMTFEAGPKAHPKAVYQMIEHYLNPTALPPSALRVVGATLMITFHGVSGGKPKTLTFDISHPSSCDLKSRSDDLRAIGERCLQRWGITS